MSDHRDAQKIAKAREQANLARLRFAHALDSTRHRVAPGRLKEDALVAIGDKVDETKQAVRDTVRKHPVIVGTAAIGTVAVLFWKPARAAALFGLHAAELIWFNRNLWRSRS